MGVPVDHLDVNADVEARRAYCRRNLAEYWRPQIERLAELAEVESLVAWACVPGVVDLLGCAPTARVDRNR